MRSAWSIIRTRMFGLLAAIGMVIVLNLLAWAGHMTTITMGAPR